MNKCSFHSAVIPKIEESTMVIARRRLSLRKKVQRLLSAAAAIVFIRVILFQIIIQSQNENSGDQSLVEVVHKKERDSNDILSIMAPTSEISTSTAAANEVSKYSAEDGVGANGAWWLDTKAPEYGHFIDVALCQALEDLFDGQDVLDLGTGLGHYGRCFLRKREPMFPENPGIDQQFYHGINHRNQSHWWNTTNQRVKSWTGYDGSPNVEQVTKGFVKHMDLTKDQDFKGQTWDWVMSLEVGEHIPAQFEDSFISNIIKPVKHNLVLSWAVRGQGGRSHINELNNTEVVERLFKRGFTFDTEKSKGLRRKATASWFKVSLMVFRKTTNED